MDCPLFFYNVVGFEIFLFLDLKRIKKYGIINYI